MIERDTVGGPPTCSTHPLQAMIATAAACDVDAAPALGDVSEPSSTSRPASRISIETR